MNRTVEYLSDCDSVRGEVGVDAYVSANGVCVDGHEATINVASSSVVMRQQHDTATADDGTSLAGTARDFAGAGWGLAGFACDKHVTVIVRGGGETVEEPTVNSPMTHEEKHSQDRDRGFPAEPNAVEAGRCPSLGASNGLVPECLVLDGKPTNRDVGVGRLSELKVTRLETDWIGAEACHQAFEVVDVSIGFEAERLIRDDARAFGRAPMTTTFVYSKTSEEDKSVATNMNRMPGLVSAIDRSQRCVNQFPPAHSRLFRVAAGLTNWTPTEAAWLEANPKWQKHEENLRRAINEAMAGNAVPWDGEFTADDSL